MTMKKALKWILITIAGLLAAVLVALSIILSPGFLTKTANKLASRYVDGTATIGKLDVTVFRTWPDVRVEIDSLLVTYPHDTFARFDSLTVLDGKFAKAFASELSLLDAGRTSDVSGDIPDAAGVGQDTLAVLDQLSAKADILAFIRKQTILVPEVTISGLKAFAHIYNDSTANWSIIRLPESTDTSSKPLPLIEAEKISISGIRDLVLTSPADTLYARASFDTFNLDGSLGIDGDIIRTAARLMLDADAHFRNASLGEIDAPLNIDTDAKLVLNPGETAIDVKKLTAQLASIPLEASGELRLLPDSTYVSASAAMENCPAGQLLKEYGRFLPPVVDALETDADVTLRAEADGWFGSASGILPLLSAEISVPDSHIGYAGLFEDGLFDLTLKAATDEAGILTADLEDLCFDIQGVSLNVSGTGSDLLGQDPKFSGIKAFACTEFADLVKYLPPETGISASGDVDFEVEGDFALSQLNLQNIHQSDLRGHIFSEGFRFSMPGDTLSAYASHPDIHLSTEGSRLSVKAGIDSIRFIAGASTYIMGTDLDLDARNNGRIFSDAGKIQPLTADVKLKSFNMRGTDSLTLGVRNSSNRFALGSMAADGTVRSNVSVRSTNKMAFMRSGANRFTLADPAISASLRKREGGSSRRGQGGRTFSGPDRARLDSAFRMRTPGDSSRRLERALPDYLKEIDFRKKDLSFNIGEGLNDLFRKWAPEAEVGFSLGTISTPVLPLKNSITSFDAKFDGDKLELDNFLITSGTSTVGFRGTVTGIEPVLLGRRNPTLNAIVTLHSRMLNLNELLAALQAGAEISPVAGSDQEYVIEGLENAEETLDFSAIIIPSNVNANLTVDIDSVRYSKIAVGDFSSRIRMRERCIQLTNTSASSEFGSVNVDGFYSTVAKDDITAGFNLKLSSITADRIITLLPAVDSLVPMLKSFKGDLNCEVAATSQLDTNMNILIPTISGAVKISGSGLELSDTGDLRRIARLLQFKDAKVGHIDDMSVNGIVADNQLEVFPFILGVDRYTLGLSGLQGFDQHFAYHISVIKSPLPFKFGVNLKGTFDDWSFSLGKPKYKSTSIPLFSPQVDTLQVNLATSIKNIFRKGVDAAVREYAQERQRVNARREEFGLFEDNEDEELTAEERDQLDAYMLDLECEAESEALEREIDEFFEEDMMSGILAELLAM